MIIGDFHIHSKYSRATSADCVPESLDLWARRKGISLLGTGDFTHPAWREMLAQRLEPAPEEGLYVLREELRQDSGTRDDGRPRFIVTGEISSIYKKNGRVRKVHNLILLPSLEAAQELSLRLEAIGNIHSDGRPILGLDSRDLLEITLEAAPDAVFIPAHIWTPHFSLFGAFSGFDTIEECFEDLTPYIHALETGLSSDPPMNWRLSALDRFLLVSNSDAHSPQKLGREANLLTCPLSYPAVAASLRGEQDGLAGTIEFFPEEGKYHFDGHRACHVCLAPPEAERTDGLCPVCGKRMTTGVLHRVEQLADRPEGTEPPGRKPFERLIPLPEVIGASLGISAAGKRAAAIYERLLHEVGPEFFILREAPLSQIETVAGGCVAEGLRRMRAGEVELSPGFDGEYGKIQLLSDEDIGRLSGQMTLFGEDTSSEREAMPKVETPKAEKKPEVRTGDKGETDDLLGSLNDRQQEAVTAPERAVAVIAGPGTGKTRTLTAKILYLVTRLGIRPSEITAVTFTKRAAGEMLHRLESQPGGRKIARSAQIGTFHSICLAALRAAGDDTGILGDPDALALVKRLCRDAGYSRSARSVLSDLSKLKSGIAARGEDDELSAILEQYNTYLAEKHLMDYDDILLRGLELFGGDTKGKTKLFRPFTWLLVDEFQDISPLQYRLIRTWAQAGKGLFVIGDPDQAIYGFRGADPLCFEKLAQDFPEVREILLEQNYRSTPQILKCAAAILPNTEPLRPSCGNGDPVRLLRAADDFSEALFLAKEINRMVGGMGMLETGGGSGQTYSFSDIAVLYRTHRQAELLEKCLSIEGIPYITAGRGSFLEEPAPRAAMGFFTGLLSPSDPHGWEVFRELAPRPALLRESELAETYLPRIRKEKPYRILEDFARDCGMAEDPSMQSLIRAAVFHASLADFLETAALGEDGDILRGAQKKYRPDCVSLMTFHASKGLEFPVVFVCGAREGIVPLETQTAQADLPEERRLFYVAMTRARRELLVISPGAESRFLKDLPEDESIRGAAEERRQEAAGGVQLSFF